MPKEMYLLESLYSKTYAYLKHARCFHKYGFEYSKKIYLYKFLP